LWSAAWAGARGGARLTGGVADAAGPAARSVARATAERRGQALTAIAAAIDQHRPHILAASARDVAAARDAGVTAALLDRLMLDDRRVTGLARAVAEVADAPDVLGRVERAETRPNGLALHPVRIPPG